MHIQNNNSPNFGKIFILKTKNVNILTDIYHNNPDLTFVNVPLIGKEANIKEKGNGYFKSILYTGNDAKKYKEALDIFHNSKGKRKSPKAHNALIKLGISGYATARRVAVKTSQDIRKLILEE